MEHQVTYVGIDVSKVRVDVAVRPSGDGWSVNYDESGVAALVVHWQAMNPAPVLLEASGGMEIPMVSALAAAALPVVVVNPRQVRDFAKATGRLAKTGALDAQVLAHFGEGVRPASRPAALGSRGGRTALRVAPGISAGTGSTGPKADCCARRCGVHQSGQRNDAG